MSDTKTREALLVIPDDVPEEHLPEPVGLNPEQLAAQADAEERSRLRQREWEIVIQALSDNSLAVTRAMRRFRNESEQEQVERVLSSVEDGSFLVDRLGAGSVVDQDLAVVLLTLIEHRPNIGGHLTPGGVVQTGHSLIETAQLGVLADRQFVRKSRATAIETLRERRRYIGPQNEQCDAQQSAYPTGA